MKKIYRKFVMSLFSSLHNLGIDISKIEKKHPFNKINKKFFKDENLVIFDVGANRGQTIKRFNSIFNNTNIHSFEPLPNAYADMYKNNSNNKNIVLNNYAIGSSKEKKTFNVNVRDVASSFVKLNLNSQYAINRSNDYSIKVEDLEKEIIVNQDTLDNYILDKKIKHVHILKIDTQGYEDEVLKGALNSITKKMFDVIEIELIWGNAYQKPLFFYDIEKFLVPNGYKLFAVYQPGRIGFISKTIDDLMSAPDMGYELMYVSDHFYKKYINNK